MNDLNIPECYTKEGASLEDKKVYKEFQKFIEQVKESSEKARGCIFDGTGKILWQEPESEWLGRVNKTKEK